jgi:hypothetical protein
MMFINIRISSQLHGFLSLIKSPSAERGAATFLLATLPVIIKVALGLAGVVGRIRVKQSDVLYLLGRHHWVVHLDLLPAQLYEVHLAAVVLGQPMQLAKLSGAVLAAVPQQSRLFTASGALPPRQLLLHLLLGLLFATESLNFGFGQGEVFLEVAVPGELGSFGDILKVLFFSG